MDKWCGVAEATSRIKQMGLIAVVRGDLPVHELLEIGDALLAAPLTVIELLLNGAEALAAVAELRQRFGQHMLIGAGDVQTGGQATAALAAGAQFIASPGFDDAIGRCAQAADVLYLPG